MNRTPKRIQRKRTKGWKMPEGAVYVGRPTKWGNPFVVREYGLASNRSIAVAMFRDQLEVDRGYTSIPPHRWPAGRVPRQWTTIEDIQSELSGKDLACWCPLGQPCHADVLLEIANS